MENQDRRRGHFHRSRRGPDRRGFERRTPPPQPQETGRDHVDVEQIMREIRARIAQRHGIELSTQQIQELAARRLESILDPRAVKPPLLDQIRRAAGSSAERPATDAPAEPPYTFEPTTIYDSPRGILRFVRRLLNPLLRLFFNPSPIVHSLAVQASLNTEAARREAQRDRLQVEWNALQYEIVQRLVIEVSRVSLELQALSTRIESLSAKVDFNERRVRGIEGAVHQTKPAVRAPEPQMTAAPVTSEPAPAEPAVESTVQTGDTSRRRRRRRRGRRGGGAPGEAAQPAPATVPGWTAAGPESFPAEAEAPAAGEPPVEESLDTRPIEEREATARPPERHEAAPVMDTAPPPPPLTWEDPPASAPPAPGWEEPAAAPPPAAVPTDRDSTGE